MPPRLVDAHRSLADRILTYEARHFSALGRGYGGEFPCARTVARGNEVIAIRAATPENVAGSGAVCELAEESRVRLTYSQPYAAFSFLIFAHLARCAAAILFRAAADIFRRRFGPRAGCPLDSLTANF